jgi:hypothetical protein
MIINYASSGVIKLKASLKDNARVIIYDRHMFIVQATVQSFHLKRKFLQSQNRVCHKTFLQNFCKLDCFINANNNCLGALKRSSLQTIVKNCTPKMFIRLTPGANVIKLFTVVIYHHSTVISSFCVIKIYYLGNYCGMQ